MTQHNKLVRDKIPQIIKANGDNAKTRMITDDKKYLACLIDKLLEEAKEVKEDPSLDELADTLEVLLAIGEALGHTSEAIEEARIKKAIKRGGFKKRIFLVSTDS